jgi:hypothetical protein
LRVDGGGLQVVEAGARLKVQTAVFRVGNQLAAAFEHAATFSGSHNETVTASTDAGGVADLATSVRSRDAGFQVCVDDISASGASYDPAANVETCDVY